MNIVFLDAFTVNPGDLSFEALENLGNFNAYERTRLDELPDRTKDAEIVIVNKFVINEESLKFMPKLKYIIVAATGFNNIDIDATKQLNIPVSNVKAYGSESVAQHVFSVILTILNKSAYYDAQVKNGRWYKTRDFCFYDHSIMGLTGKTLGILGYGEIGSKVAAIGYAFGMNVIAKSKSSSKEMPDYIKSVSLEDLFQQSDILSLHCPLNDETKKIVNKENLSKMNSSSILVNTGRGGLIDENALFHALDHGVISAAALDVLTEEPPHYSNPLVTHQKVLITPHIAWANVKARRNLIDGISTNIEGFLNNKSINSIY
jgi:glycerate dehydrogenase